MTAGPARPAEPPALEADHLGRRFRGVTAVADVSQLSDAALVNLHLHPNEWFVRHARRVLQERASAGRDMTAVQAGLRHIFEEQSEVPRKLNALWTLNVTGGAGAEWLEPLLSHSNEHVRAWAI